MKSYQIVADNLTALYKQTGLNSAKLSAACEKKGITLSPSTLSRFLNGGNSGIGILDSIVEGLSAFPNCAWIDHATLLKPNAFSTDDNAKPINLDNLNKYYSGLFIDLHEIGWLSLNKEVSLQSLIDFSVHKFRKSGFEIQASSTKPGLLKSGS